MEEKLKNLTISQALMIGIGLAALYYFAVYNDGSALETQISTTRQQIVTNQAEVETLNKAIMDAERFQQSKAALGAEMDKVLQAIPNSLTALELMRIMSNEAKSIGVEIRQINSPQGFRAQSDSKLFYEPVPIDIEISGTYNQIMLFLSNLTRLNKIITAKSLQLNVAQMRTTGSGIPTLSLKASLNAYRYNSGSAGDKK